MYVNVKHFIFRACLATAACLSAISAANANGTEASIPLSVGQQHILMFAQELEKIAVSDPEAASVQATDVNEVLVTATGVGEATVRVWLKGSDKPKVTSYLVSSTAGNRHPAPMQVQTDIRIVEVNRQELNALGVYYAKLFNGGSNSAGIAPSGGAFRGFGSPAAGAEGISGEGFNLFSFGSSSQSIVNALESGGFAYTLAEPSLVSLSGQQATFLSGGEFPVPVPSGDGDIQIEYREYGVSLALTPTVIDKNQVILKVAPEVSELDFTSGVQTDGVAVPGLSIRRTETTVSMAPGESFIISGLVSRSTTNNSDRIPGLGSIPILGAFFRSDRVSSQEKELIMIVTPRLVSPQKELSEEARSFGKRYEYSSTKWGDMFLNTKDGTKPIESGLSW